MGGAIFILNKNATNINCYLRNVIQYKFHKQNNNKKPPLKKGGTKNYSIRQLLIP
jgi:hypothetical protein